MTVVGGQLPRECCCTLSCEDVDCDWHPCKWSVGFTGGTVRKKARYITTLWKSCQVSCGCATSWTDPACDWQTTPKLYGCIEEEITFSNFSGNACLFTEPSNCVCYWSPGGGGSGSWNQEHDTNWCSSASDIAQVTISLTRTTTVNDYFCGTTGQCEANPGTVTQTWSWVDAWGAKAICNPLLGPFGQQYTDGRIAFTARDPSALSHANETTPPTTSQLTTPPSSLFPQGSTTAWTTLLSRGGTTSASSAVVNWTNFEAWGYVDDANSPGVLRDLQVPAQYVSGVNWGAGFNASLCSLNYVDPSGLATTATDGTYGVLGLTSVETPVPSISSNGFPP